MIKEDPIIELNKSISEIKVGMDIMKNDILPAIANDARTASDTVLILKESNKNNEQEISDNKGKIDTFTKSITKQERDTAGLSKWRTYLATIIIPIALTALGLAGKAIGDAATANAERESQKEDIDDLKKIHREDINDLKTSQARNIRYILHEVKIIAKNLKDEELKIWD